MVAGLSVLLERDILALPIASLPLVLVFNSGLMWQEYPRGSLGLLALRHRRWTCLVAVLVVEGSLVTTTDHVLVVALASSALAIGGCLAVVLVTAPTNLIILVAIHIYL